MIPVEGIRLRIKVLGGKVCCRNTRIWWLVQHSKQGKDPPVWFPRQFPCWVFAASKKMPCDTSAGECLLIRPFSCGVGRFLSERNAFFVKAKRIFYQSETHKESGRCRTHPLT